MAGSIKTVLTIVLLSSLSKKKSLTFYYLLNIIIVLNIKYINITDANARVAIAPGYVLKVLLYVKFAIFYLSP